MRALPQHTRMHYSNYSFTPLAGLLCVLELLGPRRHVCVKCVSPLGLRLALGPSACVAGVPRCATRATFEGDGGKINY